MTNTQIKTKKKDTEKVTKGQYKQVNYLFKKHKGLIFSKKSLVKLKEPIIQLLRENGKVEYYECIKTGDFEFDHTNGDEMIIHISPDTPQHYFKYGRDTLRGYILDENNAFPIPEDPLVTTQTMRMIVDKITHDIKTARTQEIEARGVKTWKLLIGIAIVITAIAVGAMIVPWDRIIESGTPVAKKAVVTTGKIVKENMTSIMNIK